MIGTIITSILISTAPLDTVPGAIQVKPIEINRLTKDTLTQVTWSIFGLSRDSTQGCNSYVVGYDKKDKKIIDGNVPIPAEIVKQWGTDNTLIDDYILKFYNLIKR